MARFDRNELGLVGRVEVAGYKGKSIRARGQGKGTRNRVQGTGYKGERLQEQGIMRTGQKRRNRVK